MGCDLHGAGNYAVFYMMHSNLGDSRLYIVSPTVLELIKVVLCVPILVLRTNRRPFLSAGYAEKPQFCASPGAVNTVGYTI